MSAETLIIKQVVGWCLGGHTMVCESETWEKTDPAVLHTQDRTPRDPIMGLLTSAAVDSHRKVPFDFAQGRLSLSPVANEFGLRLYFAGSEYSYS